MTKAFVLINVESGTEEAVRMELKKIGGVEETFLAYGEFDIITKIEAGSLERLKDMIAQKIRAMSKVRSTLTLITLEEPARLGGSKVKYASAETDLDINAFVKA